MWDHLGYTKDLDTLAVLHLNNWLYFMSKLFNFIYSELLGQSKLLDTIKTSKTFCLKNYFHIIIYQPDQL